MDKKLLGKKVVKTNGCISCGYCTSVCDAFSEDSTGNVTLKENYYVSQDNVDIISDIIENCPQKCINVSKQESVFSSLSELKKEIERKYGNFSFPMPDQKEYDFHKSEFSVVTRSGSGQYRYEYKSDSKATSAGLQEFKRCMYSQLRPIIIQLLVDYKNRKLMKYVEYKKQPGNFYYDILSSVEKDFALYVHEIERLKKKEIPNNESLCKIKTEPKFDFGDWGHVACNITNIEEVSYTDGIMNQIDPYYKYEIYINTDEMDRYEGRREKTFYCYSTSEACEELAKDILWAADYELQGSSDIKFRVEDVIKDSVKEIETEINNIVKQIIKLI